MAEKYNFDGAAQWRCIGPFRGGRVVTVAGDVSNPTVFYFGACAGGVWKTEDAGTYWECVSDGYFNTASVGAIAVSESDPNVIYAGTGEATIRIDVSHGDGVYRSTDAGRTWKHIGLSDTRHIGKIRIHPKNPDIVYVAALGHAFGPNEERGVFKSVDGGETWKKVLFISENTGAIDLTIDVNNPRIMYAATWQVYRNFWDISSGGPESGIWKSVDGGETWTNISQNKGLPEGVLGKIGIAASPAQPGRVFALIEAKKGGMYRSDDYGETWEFVAENDRLISRAWYYMHVTADPQDGDTVYVNNLSFWKSVDGGKTYTDIGTPHGDNHDLWIDPNNPQRMIQGNDGGANVSLNGGATWSTIYNQPTAQFYHLAVDNRKPYRVYGTQQDNSSICVPSRSETNSSILWSECYPAGTGESGYIAVRPDNPDIVYVGAIGSSPGGGNSLQRYDHKTRQIRLITTWPEALRGEGGEAHKYRFAWTYPIVISPHDPNTVYAAGNIIFKTTNEGQSWEAISPDLTVADPETLKPSGGAINRDAVGAEIYATVFAFAESLHEKGVLWAGSDDGLVHISKDGGANWTNITPKDLPERTMITMIEPSPHDPATAYMSATRYKLDDYKPYLYKTTDYGQTWQAINNGIDANDFTRAIREDPEREGLLYVGTETKLYISADGGENWQPFQLNLPITPIHDLLIKDDDLVVATHGRSFWILDDLTTVRQIVAQGNPKAVILLEPGETERILPRIFENEFGGAPGKNYMGSLGVGAAYLEVKTPENATIYKYLDSGTNPPRGAVITYYLPEKPDGKITLTFMNESGDVLRTFTNLDDEARKAQEEQSDDTPKELYIPANEGWNRFIWDLRVEDGVRLDVTNPQVGLAKGPMIPPGSYQVQLKIGDEVQKQSFIVVPDGKAEATQEDLQAQYDLLIQIRDKLSDANTAINQMGRVRKQLDSLAERLKRDDATKSLAEQAQTLKDKVLEIEKVLLVPDVKPGWPDMSNHGAQLVATLSSLPAVVGTGDYRPTDQSYDVLEKVGGEIDEQIAQFKKLKDDELTAFNKKAAESNIAHVGV